MARSNLYRVRIISRSNKIPTVRGWLPEEFSFSVESEWEPLFPSGGIPGLTGIVGTAISSGGYTTKTINATSQAWSGSSPIEFSLPIDFVAVRDAQKEVVTPVKNLMKLALPGELDAFDEFGIGNVFLDPPGPVITDAYSAYRDRVGTRGDNIALRIGNFIIFKDVIITNVSANWVGKLSPEGLPMQAQAEVTIRTYTMISKEQLEEAFL